jgi:hypothetical protein
MMGWLLPQALIGQLDKIENMACTLTRAISENRGRNPQAQSEMLRAEEALYKLAEMIDKSAREE